MASFRLIVLGLFATALTITTVIAALSPTSVLAQEGVCPENPAPVDPADPAIILDEPTDGDEVTSPMRVAGQARVFEANVLITLLDAQGNELVSTFTTAEAGAPEMGPFATEIEFVVSETQPGCLRVFEEGGEDGAGVNIVQVELVLVADPVAPTPVAPKTGSGGLEPTASDARETGMAVLVVALAAVMAWAAVRGTRGRR